ncbi:hypothetical protein K1719_046305 [Acacia pycnantha]|nr:hypothetical protein K1719_046305 [Acacia pycnantha]
MFEESKFVRMNIRDLPSSIGIMKHLRYLNLYHCENLTSLAKSVSNLVNLQTLNLMGCHALKFPIDWVTKLVILRHLHINDCKAFEGGMPMGLEKLTALESLSDFRVGNDTEEERKYAELNELKELNLRHELSIENLNLVRDVGEESKDVHLKAKKNLKNCQHLPSLQALVSLKNLCIWNMDDLEYICYEGCSSSSMAAHRTSFFPSLKDIYFSDCKNLRGWHGEADASRMHHSLPSFQCLSYLIIQDCPNLSSMPTFNLVERLVLKNCSTKPLIDTVKASTTTQELLHPSLSMLEYLGIHDMDVEALPEEWMRNLSSLKNLSIGGLSSLVTLFRHLRHLPAPLEQDNLQGIHNLDPWSVADEGFSLSTEIQALRCLGSLQTIHILFSENPGT